jgi:phage N-6-adenine-methyltransferase
MEICWETPQNFFNELNREFSFVLDVCAVESDAKVQHFLSPAEDGLSVPWHSPAWMNPPYDRSIGLWVEKAYKESQKGKLIVCLLPGRSNDTQWFHNYVMRASEIRFIKDRIHFGNNGKFSRANISSIIVVFKPFCVGPPVVSNIDRWGRPCNQPPDADRVKAGSGS